MTTLQDYRDREHWSYSSLSEILSICSLRWAFQRLYRLVPEFKPASMSFGSAFHRALEWVAHLRREGKQPKDAEASDLFDELWRRQLDEDGDVKFDEESSVETCAAQGRDMVACFVRETDPAERVLRVNQAFCVPLVDAGGNTLQKPLVGEMDCLIEKDGNTVIVDWKTSGRRWPRDKADRDMQPSAYLYAAQIDSSPNPSTTFRFDIVVKNKTPVMERHTTTRTADQMHRFVELVKLADRMVEHEVFVPNEQGFYCNNCGFQSACKNWHHNRAKLISVAA